MSKMTAKTSVVTSHVMAETLSFSSCCARAQKISKPLKIIPGKKIL